MFDNKKDKDNVCYCKTCAHKTAKECIELQCGCCLREDKIRFEHIIIPESDLSYEERESREASQQAEEEREQKAQLYNWLGNA